MVQRSWIAASLAAFFVGACSSSGAAAQERLGDVREIRLVQESKSEGGGSSGNSRTSNRLIERVIEVSDAGIQLEYDLPRETAAEDRARDWMFPARILSMPDGRRTLLNTDELATRLEAWLRLGGISRDMCGKWMFTWTAFKIECDPQAVLSVLAPYNLRQGVLKDGALLHNPILNAASPMSLVSSGPEGSTYLVQAAIDPELVRREQAEANIIVAQILGQPALSLEAALTAEAARQITGDMTYTIETDATGRVKRTTSVVKTKIVEEDGTSEYRTTTTTIEQKLLPDATSSP